MKQSHIERYLSQGIQTLRQDDPQLFEILEGEHQRQSESLSLIASSGGSDSSVLAATGSTIVNVTAEGYPGKRYHAGCRFVDKAEQLAIDRAKQVFGARYVNVQPHCASFANHTVMQSLLVPGDTILGMSLDQGGHLTHGAPANLSGKLYKAVGYGLDSRGLLDYRQMRECALEHRPRLIVCGTTSYTRVIDFDRIREIAEEAGAYVLADITHIAGLVAAGIHPSPIDAAHFTTTCTFKQLYGPRGALIMMGRDADSIGPDGIRSLSHGIQSAVFPLMQGSPEVHSIAAKARAMGRLLEPGFRDLARLIQANASELAAALLARGYDVISGGTDNHMVLFRVPPGLSGETATRALEYCGILVNKNKIPGDYRGAATTSGLRLGSNTVSLRGMGRLQMQEAVELIDTVLHHARSTGQSGFELDDSIHGQVTERVRGLCRTFPLPYDYGAAQVRPTADAVQIQAALTP
ncbi:serine hydroxymethyltransferase [Rhodanobacter sp. DHG33]|uniref:serine hydroxymethyltransferase n=1 Tax=Rhodanobacter sp. DHG33 TaxID=2775921 RepID=UPI0017801EA3|nr:serine hydroxymethyltransferase [Rhodanobacter sp. DHG33]MBD8900602.1 serine hydroxymethyltransferase [Rhodanobacter sp. DHG33]